jgi:hypothetical protein
LRDAEAAQTVIDRDAPPEEIAKTLENLGLQDAATALGYKPADTE